MNSDKRRSLRQRLQQLYSSSASFQPSFMSAWIRSLRTACRSFALFMVQKPPLRSNERGQSAYAQKIRLYPYLPSIEEERDWLERIYQDDSTF
ncbi:hypothetical protein [Egbenema bharatensis]|uniref:hypothetical protein n=1 Tax=Egbenema bharatensis TaxID=3463334 RepID=UPI003A848AC8